MPADRHAGDVLANRYRLDDLLVESRGGRFWRAHDVVLHRPVAVHIIGASDSRADALLETARRVAPLSDRRVLRVLDAERTDELCYVVNEWGRGESLDDLVDREGPMPPRRAAWVVAEVAESLAAAHALDISHGRLVPENVMIDHHGHVRIIGLGVDAALRGLPAGRRSADVTDAVALLYFLLTGCWPGVSVSAVRPAPVSGGHPLRPRQVRAGIPRPLDALCDEVLNPTAHVRATRSDHDVTTAAGVEAVLRDYLGDYLGEHDVDHTMATGPLPMWVAPEAQAGPAPTAPVGPAVTTTPDPEQSPEAEADAPVRDPGPAPAPAPDPDPAPGPGAGDEGEPPSQATQAGMPVFHDDSDDVGWMHARATAPVPPPALGDPEPKPLFAPDPPDGQPARRPRPGTAAAAAATGDTDAVRRSPGGRDYWPWQSDTDSRGSGAWSAAAWDSRWESGSWTTDTSEQVPGRSWLRLAVGIGLAVVLLIGVLAAYQLRWAGLGPAPERDDGPGARPTQTRELVVLDGLSATDFDPQGSEPREENPELAPLAVDGDSSTAWRTATYRQNFGPGGLKDGVGLVIDLGATRGVREVAVAVEGETTLSAFVTTTAPTAVADLTPVGSTAGNGVITVSLDESVTGRFVTVWLTSLPQVDDGFRGTVAEVQVRA